MIAGTPVSRAAPRAADSSGTHLPQPVLDTIKRFDSRDRQPSLNTPLTMAILVAIARCSRWRGGRVFHNRNRHRRGLRAKNVISATLRGGSSSLIRLPLLCRCVRGVFCPCGHGMAQPLILPFGLTQDAPSNAWISGNRSCAIGTQHPDRSEENHASPCEDDRAKIGRKPTRYPLGDFNIRADLCPSQLYDICFPH